MLRPLKGLKAEPASAALSLLSPGLQPGAVWRARLHAGRPSWPLQPDAELGHGTAAPRYVWAISPEGPVPEPKLGEQLTVIRWLSDDEKESQTYQPALRIQIGDLPVSYG